MEQNQCNCKQTPKTDTTTNTTEEKEKNQHNHNETKKNQIVIPDFSTMSVKELKHTLSSLGVDFHDCLEKSDFVKRAKESFENRQKDSNKFILKTIPVGPLNCNMVIIGDPSTKNAVLVDPGGDAQKIIDLIKSLGVVICQILVTHAHFDHFLAAAEIKQFTKAPICLNQSDQGLWRILPLQCGLFGVPPPTGSMPEPDQWLQDGQKLSILDGVCIHTPGHSPGSMCYYFASGNTVMTGDTLFKDSIGRTDLMGGDSNAIVKSIQDKLYTLPDNTKVIPGHGESTTIGFEKKHNQVVRARSSL